MQHTHVFLKMPMNVNNLPKRTAFLLALLQNVSHHREIRIGVMPVMRSETLSHSRVSH